MSNDTRINEFLQVIESNGADEETKKLAQEALKKYLKNCS